MMLMLFLIVYPRVSNEQMRKVNGVLPITIGVLSDTHIPHRLPALPAWVPEAFRDAGVSLILHAGDVDEPGALRELSAVAPIVAVRGNIHFASRSRSSPHLPYVAEIEVAGRRIIVTHGHGRPYQWLWDKRRGFIHHTNGQARRHDFSKELIARNARRFPYADVLIFGHSHHRVLRQMGHTLFLNPGAIAHARDETPSIAILTIDVSDIIGDTAGVQVRFIEGEKGAAMKNENG